MTADELRVEALIYLVSDARVSALRIRRNEPEVVDLATTAEILPRIEQLRDDLSNPSVAAMSSLRSLSAFVSDWGTKLFPAGFPEPGTDAVVLVPHALLHTIPIHLVEPAGFRSPLAEIVGTSYVSSLTRAARCAHRNPTRKVPLEKWRFDPLDPSNENGSASLESMVRQIAAGGADVVEEDPDAFVTMLGDLMRRSTQLAKNAGAARIGRNQLASMITGAITFDHVLLLAAHGFVDRGEHRMSGLLLPGTTGQSANRVVDFDEAQSIYENVPMRDLPMDLMPESSRAEVFTLHEVELDGQISAELVALLGCSAGMADVHGADEPASLAEALLRAGCPSIVAPMWDADIQVVESWMSAFLRAWLVGCFPKSLAARHAFAQVRAAGVPDLQAGVLTLRGDWL